MASSGVKSRNVILPTSGLAERNRQVDAGISSFPGLHEGIRQSYGTISEIHQEKPLVKAFTDDGAQVADGKFIPLNHSSLEIAERWGTIRQGMRILISYTGPDGNKANATIVGVEGERNINTPFTENTAERGLFRIFSPGVGG